MRIVLLMFVLLLAGCGVLTLGQSEQFQEHGRYSLGHWQSASVRRLPGGVNSTLSKTYDLRPRIGELNIIDNHEVERFVRFYSSKRRVFVQESIDRRREYRAILEGIFEEHGLPVDLINVALVESGYKSTARSQSGAVGMWQFTKSTAKVYGLKVNFVMDDRRDYIKSTHAAAQHLTYLYDVFDDWYLAIAAYNGGVGRVRGAIRKLGSRDFFEIAKTNLLRKETREFVPKVLAVTKISRDPSYYGFSDTASSAL